MARTEITTEIMDIVNAERKAELYSTKIARKAKRECEKRNLALSIIGGAFLSLPLFYGMLFITTLV